MILQMAITRPQQLVAATPTPPPGSTAYRTKEASSRDLGSSQDQSALDRRDSSEQALTSTGGDVTNLAGLEALHYDERARISTQRPEAQAFPSNRGKRISKQEAR